MELEEAIKILNFDIKKWKIKKQHLDLDISTAKINEHHVAVETLLNHLTKQEKMIELMSRFIDTELSSEHLSKVLKIDVKPLETYREEIIQYFEKKAEDLIE